MKTLVAAELIALLAVSARASTILFSWDTIDDPAVTAVKIYGSASASDTKPWTLLGTASMPATHVTITNIADDLKYFYATSSTETGESDPSNVASKDAPPKQRFQRGNKRLTRGSIRLAK